MDVEKSIDEIYNDMVGKRFQCRDKKPDTPKSCGSFYQDNVVLMLQDLQSDVGERKQFHNKMHCC